jgi:hypothetical protein
VIAAKGISVTANPGQSKVIGSLDPLPFTFTVGGLGLVPGDTLSGALGRNAGESIGNYTINQDTLDAGSNYAISYVSNDFTILSPPFSPRDKAALVNLNSSISSYANLQLFVLTVGATAAGNNSSDSGSDITNCEENLATPPKDKEYYLLLNNGLNLPKGVSTSCI